LNASTKFQLLFIIIIKSFAPLKKHLFDDGKLRKYWNYL